MEGELKNFIKLWILAILSICYCHTIGKSIPKGITRFFATLPVILLFVFLPLNLYTIHLGGPTSFFLSWLATFKLLAFSYGQGPLSTNPPLSLPWFISLACFPIKIRQNNPPPHQEKILVMQNKAGNKSTLNYISKILLLAIILPIYEKKELVHPKVLMLLYSIYIYISLEFLLVILVSLARACVSIEFEPQFDEPYLATSLQDFWGRRWNLMVSSILRPTVYYPIRSISSSVIGKKWASLPAILASFFVSGMMHELIFYHIGRKKPSWELTCFFLLQGLCLVIEVAAKKVLNGRYELPTMVSRLFALTFVIVTVMWLFMPQVLYSEFDIMARRETIAFINYARGKVGF